MKRLYISLTALSLLALGSCKKDSEFLNVQPTSIISTDLAFANSANVLSVLADLYNRQVDISTLKDWYTMADFSESFPSENGRAFLVQRNSWGFGEWGSWDYGYVRELNLFLERLEISTALTAADKALFKAEARFLRANYYFEITKRMGGVPLILKSLTYDFSGDASNLQFPRSKESEMYDFVIAEADAIKADLPIDTKSSAATAARASRGAALAMQARAALYAGSIAKYGGTTPAVSLPGGEVGIPETKATAYYTKALAAAKEIINGSAGAYALYNKKPDLSENFSNIFIDKGNNPETIFIEDFKLKSGKVHYFTGWNQPRYGAEEEEGGRINPSLNFVQEFELLNNTFAPIPIADGGGNPLYYSNQTDPFAGRDARLAGTVMLPGTSFKGRMVDIWNGYQMADGSVVSGDDRGQQKVLPGTTGLRQVVGFDGPINAKEFTAQSGFYLRKYLDPAIGSGSRGTNSELPFIRYRYAEVLLNAAEATFELGNTAEAALFMNQVRARAGLTVPLTAADITFDRIVHERRVELAFEGHILFDRKRWRIAHQVWDGTKMTVSDLLTNIGKATKRNTQPYALWAYKYFNPGNPNDGKWIYKIVLPSLVTGANNFQLGNYYSFIDDNIRANNPKIVKQPNQ
ncbi:RagB/SusD family nutrient uptake outer membrane protein [Lacibacter luteus]|uniref:RagB/SusD family nutrient uptake outer membrane protein n=1 Tax=Lacibacter luteus TaxID=2508719 RepID=A0A4Q1CN35_9BACT|nr:RagB/SusD family nutrient uptake outer membrane protein [Lacibacter luteus]RXK62029.1 RagB/SusD family nutrient uptake outer membrane protein [Lacibacter luteus]